MGQCAGGAGEHTLQSITREITRLGARINIGGPLPLAIFHDLTGTYTLGMVVMMALPVLSVLALVKARPGGTERVEDRPVAAQ